MNEHDLLTRIMLSLQKSLNLKFLKYAKRGSKRGKLYWKILLIPRFFYRVLNQLLFSASIPEELTLPNKIYFPHGLKGIIINKDIILSGPITIYHQVTIGIVSNKRSKLFGSPQIGKNCFLYPGCKIIGKITIGDNCKIGANTVIFRNIPNNTTAVSNDPVYIKGGEKIKYSELIN